MSRAGEYVEKLVAEGYKRELDQEENVVRSLPFFATSLGVLATALGLARPAICALEWAAFPIAIYVTLVIIGLAILFVLAFLLEATRPREFKYPMSEGALIGYREQLHDYYAASGKDEATLTEAIVADAPGCDAAACGGRPHHAGEQSGAAAGQGPCRDSSRHRDFLGFRSARSYIGA